MQRNKEFWPKYIPLLGFHLTCLRVIPIIRGMFLDDIVEYINENSFIDGTKIYLSSVSNSPPLHGKQTPPMTSHIMMSQNIVADE